MRPIRVLHCPTTVGGNPQSLARAERELGLQSWAVAMQQNQFGYPTDEVLVGPNDSRMRREAKLWSLLWRAVWDYDVIHFNFGQTIFPVWMEGPGPGSTLEYMRRVYRRLLNIQELPLLHRTGKGIVVTYQGDDARQGDYSLTHFEICVAREVDSTYYGSPRGDAAKRRRILKFDRYADRIYYLNPDLGWVLPGRARFMPYGSVDLREWEIPPSAFRRATPTVLHAPSHRGAKGTQHIIDAVHRLQAEGISFEFTLVEGLPNHEAQRLYAFADLLVDQLLAGWYGGLALELMALGKPVICYIRERDLKFIPEAMRQDLPIINATPATIHDVLKEWLTVRRHELPELGRRSRAYVERWHDPLTIAAKLKDEYETILASKRQKGRG